MENVKRYSSHISHGAYCRNETPVTELKDACANSCNTNIILNAKIHIRQYWGNKNEQTLLLLLSLVSSVLDYSSQFDDSSHALTDEDIDFSFLLPSREHRRKGIRRMKVRKFGCTFSCHAVTKYDWLGDRDWIRFRDCVTWKHNRKFHVTFSGPLKCIPFICIFSQCI
jgi:hypothetical protein